LTGLIIPQTLAFDEYVNNNIDARQIPQWNLTLNMGSLNSP